MDPPLLHFWENEDEGVMAETNATCGDIDATATVNVSRIIHVAA